MSQFDMGNLESPLSGTVFINGNLEPWRDALHSSHKGNTRPSYAVEGMTWVDDTTTPWILNMFDGSNDISIGTFDTTTNTFTPSGVSQAAEDISFDNTDSGLTATNVQDAIDEAVSDFSDFESRADGFATAAQGALADTALQPGEAIATAELTDWVAYTPTIIGCGTVSGVSFYSRRVGDTLDIKGRFTTGTVTAPAEIQLGYNGTSGGLTIDPSKLENTGVFVVGTCGLSVSSTNAFNVIATGGRTGFGYAAQGVGITSYQTMSSGVTYLFDLSLPIQGW